MRRCGCPFRPWIVILLVAAWAACATAQTPARRKPIFWKAQVLARSLEPAYIEVADGRELAVSPSAAGQCVALLEIEFEPTFSDPSAMDKKLAPAADLLEPPQADYLRGKGGEGAKALPATQARLLLSPRVRLQAGGKELAPRLTSCPDGPGMNLLPSESVTEAVMGKVPTVVRYVRSERGTAALINSGKRNTWTFVYIVPKSTTEADLLFDDNPPQKLTFRPLDWQPEGPAERAKESAAMQRELLTLTAQAQKRGDWLVAWRNACRARQLFPSEVAVRREMGAVRPEGMVARVLSVRHEGAEVAATILWMLLPDEKPPADGVVLAHFTINNARPDDVWKGRNTLKFGDGTAAEIGTAGVCLTLSKPAAPGAGGTTTTVKFALPRAPKMESMTSAILGAASVYVEASTAEGDAGKALSPPGRGTVQFDRSRVIPNRRTIFD